MPGVLPRRTVPGWVYAPCRGRCTGVLPGRYPRPHGLSRSEADAACATNPRDPVPTGRRDVILEVSESRGMGLKQFLNRIFRRRRRAQIVDPYGVRDITRRTTILDFPEYGNTQKCSLVFHTLPPAQRAKLRGLFSATTLHSITAENVNAREPDEELHALILADFLGLEFSPHCRALQELENLSALLVETTKKAPEVVAADMERAVQNDRERTRPGSREPVWYYQELFPHHKSVLILSVVNAESSSLWKETWDDPVVAYLLESQKVVPRLHLVTKLRVVREFLEIDVSKPFQPDAEQEFARLSAALNVVHQRDPKLFYRRLLETWSKTRPNPLLLRMFERP